MLVIGTCCACGQDLLTAPNMGASPINQRRAYGNACGPASLLNAFQYGNAHWRKVFDAVPGNDSRTRVRYVVSAWGNRPSKHAKNRMRWNRKEGVNLLDLTDMANEMRQRHFLPRVRYEVLSQEPRESRRGLLRRSHRRMARSLRSGLPPIISIRRFAHRYSKQVGSRTWWPVRAHFVVVTSIPRKLAKNATSIPVTYVDPYGGYTRKGHIRLHPGPFSNSPFLTADFPHAQVGKSLVRKGETTCISLTAVIGTW